ncbi:hypothetical protein DRW03_06375 [Corallococcus sp. H22C18031201]|nr:hypothetical protein DRW03_06375 [Corallococcus sp. H22C18031201]
MQVVGSCVGAGVGAYVVVRKAGVHKLIALLAATVRAAVSAELAPTVTRVERLEEQMREVRALVGLGDAS